MKFVCTILRDSNFPFLRDITSIFFLEYNIERMASLLASRLCGTSAIRFATLKKIPYRPVVRTFADDSRETVTRVARRTTLKERAMAPAGDGGMVIMETVN